MQNLDRQLGNWLLLNVECAGMLCGDDDLCLLRVGGVGYFFRRSFLVPDHFTGCRTRERVY
jgi:hypothetical protein